ncbi:Gfo/Idh/MocA family oxidoreductase [Mediterraneibacter sp. NSJ-55]|uniref:Gfo/Idh/MocA family oxidoreductase n=1 Tax=Mediterraneibacter hominis TaxID=2763054 RepID=A0A923RS45_9FIRM|nr:Gfo/Idh/MocA family oxidoreductase [Mediterraneibacter hominis]MBC5688997.1 Gfo/Idh/MocA family oxidoreductase [Mediterraneibacter hominis]
MDKMRVGVIGCGNISDIYFKNLTTRFDITCVQACSDIDMERAKKSAEKYGVPQVQTVDELLVNPEVDIVLNITIPAGHYDICKKALEAGKHVYVEKPLSVTVEQAEELVAIAEEKGLYIGCAPDTFLGGGLQTCRELLDSGVIGTPVAATAFFGHHGPERFHPDPAFLYKEGAGPMLDIGPYFLTALVSMLGPAKSVCGMATSGFDKRIITFDCPKKGETFPVETPSHVTGTVTFENGAVATVMTSFDIWGHSLPFIEVYGTKGTLRMPNPDTFGGPVFLLKEGETEFTEIPVSYPYSENSRGVGLADMAACILRGTRQKASGKMALHVLEILKGILDSSKTQAYIQLKTTCEQPEAFTDKSIRL